MDLNSILSDEKEEDTSTADSDFSYYPTPQRITRKRQSRLLSLMLLVQNNMIILLSLRFR